MNGADPDSERVRGRARLLEFLKFRVLAAQEAFFDAWRLADATPDALSGQELPLLDLQAFRLWLQPLWPQAARLTDADLRHCLEQAVRLYVDSPSRRLE